MGIRLGYRSCISQTGQTRIVRLFCVGGLNSSLSHRVKIGVAGIRTIYCGNLWIPSWIICSWQRWHMTKTQAPACALPSQQWFHWMGPELDHGAFIRSKLPWEGGPSKRMKIQNNQTMALPGGWVFTEANYFTNPCLSRHTLAAKLRPSSHCSLTIQCVSSHLNSVLLELSKIYFAFLQFLDAFYWKTLALDS